MRTAIIFATLCVFINCDDKSRVNTQYGDVKGRYATTAGKGKQYLAFQGIPYAKPPIGELRFASPVPPNQWTHTYDATKPKSICAELYEPKGSEDCLYLNVFTPVSKNISLPVIIWIHGGAFAAIFGTYTIDGVDNFIDEDVIIVTVHYRLGSFGFLSTEDAVIPGNFGLKDQLMAVEWVHRNIRQFGGDPKKVTLMGQSAGAASVQYLAMTKKLEGKISGIIQQSGSTISPWALSRYPRTAAYVLAGKLGIQTTDSSVLLQELRKKTTEEIRNASVNTDFEILYGGGTLDSLVFVPVREPRHKDAIFTSMAYEEFTKGNFVKIPRIVGFNSLEAAYTADHFQEFEKYYNNYDENIRRYLPLGFNPKRESAAKAIKQHYFGSQSFTANITKTVHYASDQLFVRSIIKNVRLVSPFVKTYLYHFTYMGKLGKENRTLNGVDHGEEMEYLFNGKHQGKLSKQDQKTRDVLVKLWSNFARTGNPTPSKDVLFDNKIWEPVNADTDHTSCFEIGEKIEVVEDPHREDVEFWERIYADHGRRPYDTY